MSQAGKRWRGFVLVAAFWIAPSALLLLRRSFGSFDERVKTLPAPPAKKPKASPRVTPSAKKPKASPRVTPDGEVRSPAAPADAAALRSLPYILQSRDSRTDLRGVIVNRKELASPGLNFFFPWSIGHPGHAYLMDMDGRIVWRWSLEDYLARDPSRPWIEHFELLPDGSVLCGLQDRSILKLDRDSKVMWECPIRAHHDIWPDSNGDLYVLARERVAAPQIHPTIPIESDAIVVLSADGKVKKRIPILDLFERSGYGYLLPRLQNAAIDPSIHALDVFHLNHVEVFDGSLVSRSPIFAKGNLLFSVRNLNTIGIVDAKTRKIVWLWGPGNLSYQHEPQILPGGNILIFDNGAERSQIVELEPLSERVTWRYAPAEGFFSAISGGVQRLGNGNTLITESMKGYAFEITRSGETVWKYANPENDQKGMRNGIIRMTRVDPARLTFLPGTSR